MTLSTDIYVHDPIDGDELFHYCRGLIGATPDTRFTSKDESISNDPDQGLCAWLHTYRVAGRPIQPEPEGHDEDCSEDCECQHDPAHWVRVNLDTAYGYRGDKGEDCSQLHADLIVQLGAWLDQRGISWSWRNEYSGEIHQQYDGLKDFLRSGKEAGAWFSSVVLPRIASEFGGGA